MRWLVLALLLAGCGTHDRVVPWKALPPDATGPPPRLVIPPLPRHARYCAGHDMRVATTGRQGINSAEDAVYLRVRNVGQTTCALRGRVEVTVVQTGGFPVRVDPVQGHYGDVARGDRTFGLAPGRSAALTVFVEHLCDVRSVTAKTSEAVALVAGAPIRTRTCAAGIAFAVEPWQPVVPPERPRPFPHLRATIEGRPSARRGATLAYRVRVEGPRGYRFPWCPLFTESIDGQNGPTFTLNCKDVELPATFELRYPLSRHYRAGMHGLSWELDDLTAEEPLATAHAQVEVER